MSHVMATSNAWVRAKRPPEGDQGKRLEDLETGNARLRRGVSDLTLHCWVNGVFISSSAAARYHFAIVFPAAHRLDTQCGSLAHIGDVNSSVAPTWSGATAPSVQLVRAGFRFLLRTLRRVVPAAPHSCHITKVGLPSLTSSRELVSPGRLQQKGRVLYSMGHPVLMMVSIVAS